MEQPPLPTSDRAGSRLSAAATRLRERGTSRLARHQSNHSKRASESDIDQVTRSQKSSYRSTTSRGRQTAALADWLHMMLYRSMVAVKKLVRVLRPTGGPHWTGASIICWVTLGLLIWYLPPPMIAHWLGFNLYLPLVLLVNVTIYSTVRLYRPVITALIWALVITLWLLARLQHIEVPPLVMISAVGAALFFDLGLHLVRRS